MEILNTREEYAPDTLTIIDILGMDRLSELQLAIASNLPEETVPRVTDIIDNMVAKHITNGEQDLAQLGYATIADAIAEIGTSKGAIRTLLKGKMGVKRAVDAHHQRAVQLTQIQDRQVLRELGTTDAPIIYIDEPTDLYLVGLVTPEHCQYEGISLVHCLGNLATARAYLDRGTLLYSLREGGTEPRVTLEVNAPQAAVTQARTKNDKPLHEKSDEYDALRRSLPQLATHVEIVPPRQLRITDNIIRA